MSPDHPLRSCAEELASRPDDRLAELLVRRPDLASPPPRGTGVLAQRSLAAASISLAGEDLDLLAVAVVEAFLDVSSASRRGHGLLGPVTRDDIVARLGRRARRPDVDARLALLADRALIWPSGSSTGKKATSWVAGVHLASALPWRTPHLITPIATTEPDEISSRIDNLDDRPRELLTTLANGHALGRSRDAAPDADPAAPVPRLIASDLLSRVDEQTVELPPQVGQILRGEPPLATTSLTAPELSGTPSRFDAATVDAAGAGEALEFLRHTGDLLAALSEAPAAVLRAGGMGVRELRRLAKATGLSTTRVGLLVELSAAGHLIDAGVPESIDVLSGDDVFAPTTSSDTWLHYEPGRRWAHLADCWIDLPRCAWRIGETDRDSAIIGALASTAFDHSAPLVRRTILTPLTEVEPAVGVSVTALTALLGWRHPRQLRRFTTRLVGETLREATELGLVAHGALTAAGRALLAVPTFDEDDPDGGDRGDLVDVMTAALPEPIDYFLVQADFTVTAPGPLTPELAERLALVADLESGGAASVYRVTEDGIRRALDTGRTAAELTALFTQHSKTPVPQSLTYLIDDVARRHGQLRVGVASSFVRCEDEATLTAVLRSSAAGDVSLRALAPTVAVSAAPLRDVVERLRAAGFAPAGEDSSGALIDLRSRGVRVPARTRRAPIPARRGRIGPGQAATVVGRMRVADRAEAPVSTATSTGSGATTSALIQLAMQTGRRLRIGYVDAHGGASRHVVKAQSLAAGQLVAVEEIGGEDLRFALHRITRVELL
ncbi:helicase-associated domain-containing protein [Gordonia sp. HY002]|uniref:helicase-associated domain-containing protein n=1 Tax=Gordonia zhenghanii TaxID=2911516 RepID=UPI001EEFFB47|nr:helicase-associated domain-containing protein [Gordonia zhenghanii]MCF8568878.1 helicase-associated domain-containing protein [Gordonia zhenghanii]MCF8602252.1 helicase-associated domain-containing protein [Gordonia zhenghanii]